MSHAPIAPSSMGVTVKCAGSVAMQAQFPQEATDESKAGDAAHWVCADILLARKTNDLKFAKDYIGMADPAGTVISREMTEAAEVFVSACVRAVLPVVGPDFTNVHIESKVHCRRVHPTLNYGTPDFWAHLANVIYVKDFKFGFGFVDEFENWQMLDYAAGVLDELKLSDEQLAETFIDMEIVQPRYYSGDQVRSWRIKASDLQQYVKIMSYQTHKALMADAECVSGDHCKNCTARRACPAARQSSYWAMQVSTEATPINLPASALGVELDYIKRGIAALEAQESGLEAYAEALIIKGEIVPGYARQPTKGKRAWSADDEQVIMIGSATGVDLRSPKPVTPSQAERLGINKTFIESQTHRPSKLKLKRVTTNEIKKVFKNGY